MKGRDTTRLEGLWTDLSAEDASMVMGGVAASNGLNQLGGDGSSLPVSFDNPLGSSCVQTTEMCYGIRLPCQAGGGCIDIPSLPNGGNRLTL